MKRPKILFLVTEDWYFCSHRLPIARAAQKLGYEVVVATRVDRHGERITSEGLTLIPLSMQRSGTNPLREIHTIFQLIRIYWRERPDVVHQVAMKPVLYGSLAALLTRVPHIVNALAGMGYVFTSSHLKARVMLPAIRTAFRLLLNRKRSLLILQNQDDRNLFTQVGLVSDDHIRVIRGSGVDPNLYLPSPRPSGPPVVMLVSRMLWDKGVGEFVEAARLLQERGVVARFVLVGDADDHNPAAIPVDQLEAWNKAGTVSWWGRREDMVNVLHQSHIACLPSYREGLPKSLLEAASCGLPIVTTDTVGCREVVKHGENGMLVPVGSTVELADALQLLIEDPGLCEKMGAAGREIVLRHFSVEQVVAETMAVYKEVL